MWRKIKDEYPGGFEVVKEFDNEDLITTNPVREIKIIPKQKKKVEIKKESKVLISPMTVSKFKKSEYTKEQLQYIVDNSTEFSVTVCKLAQKRLELQSE
jgi:hypothetical protein